MFGSDILDVIIGLSFIYLLLSLLCSSLNELVAWALKMRAKTLERGLIHLLDDPNIKGNAELSKLASRLYDHPLIKSLSPTGKTPSYIPSNLFSRALIDVVKDVGGKSAAAPEATASVSSGVAAATALARTPASLAVAEFQNAIAALPPDSQIKKSLQALVDESVTDMKEARANLEKWFDGSMERLSGLYKRKAHLIILFFAFVVSFGFNADSILIAQSISQDSALRSSLVAAAQEYVRQPRTDAAGNPQQAISEIDNKIKTLNVPIGWDFKSDSRGLPSDALGVASKLLGLAVTMLALSLGAPFWFDTLNKLVNLRSSGRKPPPSEKKGEA